jgi:hypothetical protein
MSRRQPYNPAAPVHDRRAREFNRGIASHLSPIEVDDPVEKGAKLMVIRNTRNDPLAGMHARNFIDEAQYHAGRAFQNDFETAERGPRAIDPGKEAVDGGRLPEPITDAQQKAAKRLNAAVKDLGQEGSGIIHDVLITGMGISQLVSRRGFSGGYWRELFGRKLGLCLDKLAVSYGFASKPQVPAIPQLHPLLQKAIDAAAAQKASI